MPTNLNCIKTRLSVSSNHRHKLTWVDIYAEEDFSSIQADTVVTVQELMIDINAKAFDLMCVTHEVEIVLFGLQNEQKWIAATTGSISVVGAVWSVTAAYFGSSAMRIIIPAVIAVVAMGLTYQAYSKMNKHREEKQRMNARE